MSNEDSGASSDGTIIQDDLVMEVELGSTSDLSEISTAVIEGPDDSASQASSVLSSQLSEQCTSQLSQSKDEEPAPKKRKISEERDDEGALCVICLDNWTNTGEHRICALKCGHLFGHKCISRWISSQKSCPSCKIKANKNDIRFIYANKLIAIDTSELDIIKKQLDITIEEKSRLQIELTKAICKEHLMLQEVQQYKDKIKILSTLNDGLGSNSKNNTSSSSMKEAYLKYHDSSIVCQQGTCRVMAYHALSGKFAISLKSPNLFQGFGVRLYNKDTFNPVAFMPLHSKDIRDLKCNYTNNTLLSVSLDKSLRITDINSQTAVASYTGESMLWSCCWDINNSNLLYVGEQQGTTSVFDIRRINTPLLSFKISGDTTPVVSLASIRSGPGTVMPLGGVVACKLNSIWAFQMNVDEQHSKYLIPFDGFKSFMSMSYQEDSNHLLVAIKPMHREGNMRHVVCTINKLPNDLGFQCPIVHTYIGGQLPRKLIRSCFVKNLSNHKDYAAVQSDNKIVLWSVSTGKECSNIRSSGPPIDLMPLNNGGGTYLGSLSEKRVDFYKIHDSQ